MYFEFWSSQELREENLQSALEIPWTWKWKMVWKRKVSIWGKMVSHRQPDGGTIRGIWTSSIQKSLHWLVESWGKTTKRPYTSQRMLQTQSSCIERFTQQISIHRAFASWCEKFGLKPPKTISNNLLWGVLPEEVTSLVKAPWNEEPTAGKVCEKFNKTSKHWRRKSNFC